MQSWSFLQLNNQANFCACGCGSWGEVSCPGPSQMSEVRSDLSSHSDSLNGDPVPDQTPFLPTSTDQEEISCTSSTQNPAVAPSALCHIPAPHPQAPATEEKEKLPEDDKSLNLLANGTATPKSEAKSEFMVTPEAVTRQPQVRTPLRGLQPSSPMDCTPLLQNGAGRVPDPGGTNRDAGNGVLGSLPSSQKPHRKLQSHYSINSQGSKKSKGSSKSASSQIPVEAQQDCCVHCILSCLFCEFLTLCNIVLDCATCGSCSSEDSCICCCCCGSGECAECDLPCDMDCGIVDACCESADCLEICMECCGLCFSS
ncbi:myoD family inhibitor isoform X1 [Mauremys mutica]|uniref:myoD family inhibitor isoform X1 n=1 Tax=Mauremys mutica TaxID=74926 RepID=UPI001D15FF4C|nr:myoD family inhibitor isoform X1 [Mauremys mutica]